MAGKKTKKDKPKKQTAKTKEQSKVGKWLSRSSVRPMVLGDAEMAMRIHAYFLDDESLSLLDLDAVLDGDYEPNFLLVFGPLNPAFEKRIEEIRNGIGKHRLAYVESLLDPSEEESAVESGKRLGAVRIVAKEFVTLENIRDIFKEVANV